LLTEEDAMGTWSEDTFGNDTACDWAVDLLDSPGLEAVSIALDAVLDEQGYVDSDLACEALAACEILARLQGNWGLRDAYSEELDQWIEQHPQPVPPQMVVQAEKAIARIVGDGSELAELWDQDGRNETWHSAVDDLARRVHG